MDHTLWPNRLASGFLQLTDLLTKLENINLEIETKERQAYIHYPTFTLGLTVSGQTTQSPNIQCSGQLKSLAAVSDQELIRLGIAHERFLDRIPAKRSLQFARDVS